MSSRIGAVVFATAMVTSGSIFVGAAVGGAYLAAKHYWRDRQNTVKSVK